MCRAPCYNEHSTAGKVGVYDTIFARHERRRIGKTIGNTIGKTIGNTIGNTVGNTIGNTIAIQ